MQLMEFMAQVNREAKADGQKIRFPDILRASFFMSGAKRMKSSWTQLAGGVLQQRRISHKSQLWALLNRDLVGGLRNWNL